MNVQRMFGDARGAAYGLATTALVAGLAWGAVAGGGRWDFEADQPGKPARGFTTEVGRWEVVKDADAHVLAQLAESPKPVYNVAFVDGTNYKDVDVSVRVMPRAGAIDQGGGLVWRAKDKDNYYIARYNPLESNLRVYKVENGKRTQLDHAEAGDDKGWHTIRIMMTDREITGWFDGVKLLVAEDSTFADAGRIGLWSKADAQTHFDDLTVRETNQEEADQARRRFFITPATPPPSGQ